MPAHPTRDRAIADSQFGGGATSWAPATWYLGLSTTAPNEDGTGWTGPVGGSYARVAVPNTAASFPAATTVDGVTTKTNGIKLTFPNPTGSWGQIGWYGWFTALTGGLPEFSNALDAPVTVRSGNTPVEFDVNQLVMVFG